MIVSADNSVKHTAGGVGDAGESQVLRAVGDGGAVLLELYACNDSCTKLGLLLNLFDSGMAVRREHQLQLSSSQLANQKAKRREGHLQMKVERVTVRRVGGHRRAELWGAQRRRWRRRPGRRRLQQTPCQTRAALHTKQQYLRSIRVSGMAFTRYCENRIRVDAVHAALHR